MGRLIVLTTPELEPGYRLAGATTRVTASVSEAAESLQEILAEGDAGDVVAVHEPFFNALPASLLFGAVWDRWGSPTAFQMGALIALVAAVGMAVVAPGRRALPSGS